MLTLNDAKNKEYLETLITPAYTKEQVHELVLCDNFGGDISLIADPVLPSICMNAIWNAAKQHQEDNCQKYAYLGRKYPEYMGNLDMIFAINCSSEISLENIDKIISSLIETNQLTGNRLRFECIKQNSPHTLDGRMPLTGDVNEFDRHAIMSEGDDNIKNIIQSLENYSTTINTQSTTDWHEHMTNVAFTHLSVSLKLDDMNIRGQQISHAFQYANENISTLYQLLKDRNTDLVNYVNICEAKKQTNTGSHITPMAMKSGASFIRSGRHLFMDKNPGDLIMTPIQKIELQETSMEVLTIDYTNKDIYSGISKQEAIKVAEAHGFKIGYIGPIEQSDKENIIMYNDIGDILSATCTDRNFCYGGCSITGARFEKEYGRTLRGFDIQANIYHKSKSIEPIRQFVVTYQNAKGLFGAYNTIPKPENIVSVEQKEVGNMEGIPVPEVIDEFGKIREFEKDSVLRCNSFATFHIKNASDILQLKNTFPQMTEECQKIYSSLYHNRISLAAESLGLSITDSNIATFNKIIEQIKEYGDLSETEFAHFKAAIVSRIEHLIEQDVYIEQVTARLKSALNDFKETNSIGILTGSPISEITREQLVNAILDGEDVQVISMNEQSIDDAYFER